MHWIKFNLVHCLTVFISILILVECFSGDPYAILGLNKHATAKDIRKAYKQLAKEWHPDKSNSPEAEKKFVEIKQAYELLSDTDRRRAYDNHGITDEDAKIFRESHDYSQYGRFATDAFEEFFGHRFHFDQDISLFHKLSITTKYFEQVVMPKSHGAPYILMFYTDWCFSCLKRAEAFKKMIDTLEPVGVSFATINAGYEKELLRKSGVREFPGLILVLNGRIHIFRDTNYNVQRIVEFIRKKLPADLITRVDDYNSDSFLSGWSDNRVRCLILEPRNQVRLRYLISAFQFRHRVAFGYVELNQVETQLIQEKYRVHPSMDTVLLFNEDTTRPIASLSMSDIPTATLNNVISANQYLALPRLSSQGMLEGLCPAEWNRPRKRLCVVLITENTDSHEYARHVLRKIALETSYSPEKVRFAYLFKEKQTDFVNAITKENQEPSLRIVIIWRRDTSHIKYEWLNEALHHHFDDKNDTINHVFNRTKPKLDDTIQRLLKTSEALSYEAEVKDLFDEHTQGLFSRIINRIFVIYDYIADNYSREEIIPLISLLGTLIFIIIIGYLMSYFMRLEEENIQKKMESKNNSNNNNNGGVRDTNYVPELKLHELLAEKYNGLVRMLKPGCRTIILITDMQSRAKLIPQFHKAVWPYRKNKTLMFGYMLIEKGRAWYSEILRLSLSESRELEINPRNCIGTVLALNGHRKYFCMYHAKHPETSTGGAKRMIKMTKQLSIDPKDPEAGAFLAMDDSDSDDSIDSGESLEPKILIEETLLDGLSNWLDRLFEGTTHRYSINYWPDFPIR